ncbi:hypothetical protein [Ramlibacter pallidus]|uniref:Uncharacterized protein n=1 Tax=Ramlibacter pallidus TaxID=2780087 RepID=A0ABR9S4S5_9BURK|nr:hypothetical protein [Ramlibacter pallidus]MBE7368027.1 hypothetical protein [Ramlibacter pallidus]
MPAFASRFTLSMLLALLLAAASAQAQEAPSKHLAPGFTTRPADSRLLVLPADMELFSISAGGVVEPRADWTDAAQKHFTQALAGQRRKLGATVADLTPAQAEEFHEIVALHKAVADAISLHHDDLRLPTKGKRLDWSLGDAVRPLKERTGADYALFTWMRDSYTSTERKAVLLGMALLGAIPLGGEQVGYASLVDLNTGRVVWFNELNRFWGDLREPQAASETVDALLKNFPPLQQ